MPIKLVEIEREMGVEERESSGGGPEQTHLAAQRGQVVFSL